MRFPWCVAAGLAAAMAASPAWAQLHKCKDERGATTYSDRPCALGPRPAQSAKPPPPATKAVGGKLTEDAVAKVLRYSMELAESTDHRRQCALAAPDLRFKITDHSTSPATVLAGGKTEICGLQQDSARMIEANNLRPALKTGKIVISVAADGSTATAKYDTVATFTQGGQTVLVQRCAREDALGVYGQDILFKGVMVVCRTG